MMTYGTTALKSRTYAANSSQSHLRLVYDKNRDSKQDVVKTPSATSRNKLVGMVLAFAFLVVTASFVVGNVRGTALESTLNSAQTKEVSVLPGDTLWSIAERHSVEGVSTYDEVQWIRSNNELDSAGLRVGTKLVVPS